MFAFSSPIQPRNWSAILSLGSRQLCPLSAYSRGDWKIIELLPGRHRVSCVEDPTSSARRHQTPEQPGRRLAASGKGPDGKDKRGQLRSQENSDVGRRRERLVGNKLRKITAWGGTHRSRPPACSPRQPRTEVLEVRRLQSGAVF